MEMAADKVVETVIVGNYEEMENEGKPQDIKSKLSNFLWHGGSAYDAWFSCASNQVAQVLLTLPYSFSQLGMLSGILFQLFYGLLGSWTAYLISILYVEYRTRKEREKVNFRSHVIQWFEVLDGLLGKHWRNVGLAFNCTFLLFGSVIQLIACASNIYYINDNLDKRTWTYIFGACCATTVFIPSFHNYRIWSFLGLVMTTYTAWYLTIAAILHGQMEGVKHSGPNKMVLYFTGATNILYTFGGHAVIVEIMHTMWKPQKFKAIYLVATLYVLTLTLPSAVAVYWAFGDMLLNHSNAFAPKPSSRSHKSRECLPLILILRNRLKYALTYREVIAILMQRHVLVDGKVRTDKTYPAGFMDVVFIPKTNENFRLLYDTKGRFRLHSVRDYEAKFKLCKVRSVQFGQKGIPYLNTYDGRTIRYPDPVHPKHTSSSRSANTTHLPTSDRFTPSP